MTEWRVGDPVIIEKSQYHHRNGQPYEPQLAHGTVVKVARKYFTVETTGERGALTWTNSHQFEIATGRQRPDNPNFTNNLDHVYTPAGWEAQVNRREIVRGIREHGVHGEFVGTLQLRKWSDGHLVELLDLLDRVKADAAVTNLDP